MKPVSHLVLSALLLASGAALAQTYPTKPVRMIVPFLAGGAVDTMARVFAQKFGEAWGQQVLVENRAGAGANIGADAVAKAAPDGYTILITTTGHAVAPSLYRRLPFDVMKDFAALSQITSTYLALVVNPGVPATTMKELVALAKSRPGKLNYGHTGVGVAPHLIGELFRSVTGIDIVFVPYKGDAQVVPAMLSNEVQMSFSAPTTVLQLVRSGKLRALAVTGPKRGASFPDVPTTAEAGFPDVPYTGWVGFFAPAGTPREILNKVSAETARVLRLPDVAERVPGWGSEPAGTTPDEFTAKYREDVARYAKIIKDAKIPLVD